MGSKLLKISSSRVMEIAEKLYNGGFISYPRTETNQFKDDFDIKSLINKQTNSSEWGEYSKKLLEQANMFQTPRNGSQNDKAHPFIHPTAFSGNLSGDEKKVYELIVRRFLATCSQNAKGLSTKITAQIGEEYFDANGLIVQEKNYLNVYHYEKWGDKLLPEFIFGETIPTKSLSIKNGVTSPPSLLTEADLITIMDQNGIGTDATIHEHIKKIIDRNYVLMKLKTRELYPSQLGIGLVEAYDQIGLEKSLSKPSLRKETEQLMKSIADGTQSKCSAMQQVIQEYKTMFIKALEMNNLIIETMKKYIDFNSDSPTSELSVSYNTEPFTPIKKIPIKKCDKCRSGQLLLVRTKEGKWFIGCNEYPRCKNSIWFVSGTINDLEVLDQTCSICLNRPPSYQVRLVQITIKDPRISFMTGGEIIKACIFCDQLVRNALIENSSSYSTYSIPPSMCDNTSISRAIKTFETSALKLNNTHQLTSATKINNSNPSIVRFSGVQHDNIPYVDTQEIDDFRNIFNEIATPNSNIGNATYSEVQKINSIASRSQLNIGIPLCQCSSASVIRTVTKNGPNIGRQFYSCESRKCQLFEWKNVDSPTSTTGGANSNFASNSNTVKCYTCHQAGHFSINCPNKGSTSTKRKAVGTKKRGSKRK